MYGEPIEAVKNGITYSTAYFTSPVITASQTDEGVLVKAQTGLCDGNLHRMEGDIDRAYSYSLTPDGMRILVGGARGARLVLPVISGEVTLVRGIIEKKENIFFLTGGFEAVEYTVLPDENGAVEVILR